MCLLQNNSINQFDLIVRKLNNTCRFHKRPGEHFTAEKIKADFGCLELFNIFYPLYLSMIYGSKISQEKRVLRCPSNKASVTIYAKTFPVPKKTRYFINFVKKALWRFKPTDFMMVDGGYEVIDVKGDCLVGMERKEVIRIPYAKTICPAALYTMNALKGLSQDTDRFRCPSDVNLVEFIYEKDIQ